MHHQARKIPFQIHTYVTDAVRALPNEEAREGTPLRKERGNAKNITSA